MQVVFIAAILPPLFIMIAWAAIMAIRICFPEKRVPPLQHKLWVRQQLSASRESTLVGAHEIRENQRRLLRKMAERAVSYSSPKRVVDVWAEELWSRRN
jgi:hypothetical protein